MGQAPTRRGQLIADALRFGAVGTATYALDVVIFNVLRIAPAGFLSGPLAAKTVGIIAATLAAWLGNRYWTFRRNLRPDPAREFAEFVVVAGAGYAANLLILFLSHYALGLTSLIADNIAGNVIGAALGALVRFVLYRSWVYHPRRARRPEPASPGAPVPPDPADPAETKVEPR